MIYLCKPKIKCDAITWKSNYCIKENICPRFVLLCQQANLKMSEFQSFKLSLFKPNCVWVNSRQDEIVCKCRRMKITRDEKNLYYSMFIVKIVHKLFLRPSFPITYNHTWSLHKYILLGEIKGPCFYKSKDRLMYLIRRVYSDQLLQEVCPSGGDQEWVNGGPRQTGCYDSHTALVGYLFPQYVPDHCKQCTYAWFTYWSE